jgi:hypothetical protein
MDNKTQEVSKPSDSDIAVPASSKSVKPKKVMGRPTKFTNAIAEEVCRRISNGESLLQICRDEHLPTRVTVNNWVISGKHRDFFINYARARNHQADHFFEQILDIAHDGSNDWMEIETKSGRIIEVPNHEHINRSRLRVDTLKWYLSKVLPKKYGDKLEIESKSTNETIVTHKFEEMPESEIKDILLGRRNGLTAKSN